MPSPEPTPYAARQIQIGRAALLLTLALPAESRHSAAFVRIDRLKRRMATVFKVERGIDTCRVRIRELHEDGLAERQTLPGRGLSYGWRITGRGMKAVPEMLALLDDTQQAAYLERAGRGPTCAPAT